MKRLSMLVLLLVAFTGLIAVTGCGSLPFVSPPPTATSIPTTVPTAAPTATKAPPTATASPVPTATPTSVPTPANPSASLGQIFKSWSSVKTFRAKMVTTGTAAGAVEMNMDVVMPDKFHMTTTGMEIIVIGKTFYMKVANKWQKVATLGVDLSLADPKKFEANLATTTDIKFAGAEILNGTPTLVYTYTSNVKGPPAQKIPSKMWVGALDNLPRKFEMTPKAGQTTTITYTDYNANITISAPL